MKTITILGSTGSIGTQAIEICDKHGLQIKALAAHSNTRLLAQQAKEHNVKTVCIYCEEKQDELRELVDSDVKILTGMEGLKDIASMQGIDIMLNSVVGMVGLVPTLTAIEHGTDIALANKETLVAGGKLVINSAKEKNVKIYPVDSEHSAIFQCLQGNKKEQLKSIILTASGGPFYKKTKEELADVGVEQALAHPNWSMGRKITIDSSTLVNKGLEIMEAHHLFNMSYDKIDVVVQRESIIHSMVLFVDGAVKAQLGVPSMRIPIEYALYKENRKFINEKEIDWTKLDKISIGTPDLKTFKGLALAYKAIKIGGLMPSVYNALNEVAVRRFLNKEIKYLDIADFIERGMGEFEKRKLNKKKFNVTDIERTMIFAEKV